MPANQSIDNTHPAPATQENRFTTNALTDELFELGQAQASDDSSDAVLSNGILEHVPHEQLSLSEVYRVLRHEGTLVASCLLARYRLDKCFNRQTDQPNHPQIYALAYSKKLSCSFHVVWQAFRCACPLTPSWAEPAFRVWERTPSFRHLTQNIVVVGVKSEHGMGNQDYARHNLKATLRRIESRGNPSSVISRSVIESSEGVSSGARAA